MEILPVSTSNSIAVAVGIDDSPIFVCYPHLYGNPDVGRTVEYRKALESGNSGNVIRKDVTFGNCSDLMKLFFGPSRTFDQSKRSRKSNSQWKGGWRGHIYLWFGEYRGYMLSVVYPWCLDVAVAAAA
ncbi:hypothetical protein Tco_1014463 [Tanacetum coccineum]